MQDERVMVGRVVKLFGLRGEVLVAPTGGDPARFAPGTLLYLEESDPAGRTGGVLKIARVRPRLEGFLVSFEGHPDRTSVEYLARRSLFQESSALPALPEGKFYHFQLVGLLVTRADGSPLGRVTQVVDLPGNDLYEVRGAGREWLVPARREFVAWIDLERRELRLTDRADLLEAQSDGRIRNSESGS